MNSGALVLNVVDVEATCWKHEPPPGQVSEIIEIGLTTVGLTSGERIGRHRLLVRPARSTVSGFCTELTGLTQDEVDTGIGFADACRILATEHQAGMRPWASWGDYDRLQFQRQCRATGTQYPFGQVHVNAKAVFTVAHGLRKKPGMAAALKIAELPLEGKHHSGADDAWNIAALSGTGQDPVEGRRALSCGRPPALRRLAKRRPSKAAGLGRCLVIACPRLVVAVGERRWVPGREDVGGRCSRLRAPASGDGWRPRRFWRVV